MRTHDSDVDVSLTDGRQRDPIGPRTPKIRRASVASISRQPRASTEQALKGYAYLKSRSSRSRSPNSAASA